MTLQTLKIGTRKFVLLSSIASLLSGILGVLICVASVSGHGPLDPIPVLPLWLSEQTRVALVADSVSFGLAVIRELDVSTLTDGEYQQLARGSPPSYVDDRFFGFRYLHGILASTGAGQTGRRVSGATRCMLVGIPNALAAPLLLLFPAVYWTRVVTLRRRKTHGQCLNCGYDLRATPDRCPECGTPTWKSPG